MKEQSVKVAFALEEDEERISAHFGRASAYLVVAVSKGQVQARERREKPVAHGAGGGGGRGHGHRGWRHQRMMEPIRDCRVIVARGMGAGAFGHFQEAGIEPILTEHKLVETALQEFVSGELKHRPERLHARGGVHGHSEED